MGDPFSISTGIAGLISLGVTLGNGLHTYFSAIKDRHDDIEKAQQELKCLQFNIGILKSNESKIGCRHGLAAYGLTLGVSACEVQLRSLEDLLNELTSNEGSTALRDTLRKQKMIARYPFDQKKLRQLKDELSRANVILNNFLNTLILGAVLDISQVVGTLKAFSEARGTSAQTTSEVMAAQLHIVAPEEERSTPDTTSHPTKIGKLLATPSNDITTLQQTGLNNSEMELVSRSSEQIFEQFKKAHSQPDYVLNAELEARLYGNPAASTCTCGILANNASLVFQFWRGRTIYKQGDTKGHHYPGCPSFAKSRRESSRVLLRLPWLMSTFSKAFIVSVSQGYPSGYYGISFNIRSSYVVESSPAFDLFSCGDYDEVPGTAFKVFHEHYTKYGVENMAESLIQQLRAIYHSGKSSPFDIDKDGNTIAHKCVAACQWYFTYSIHDQTTEVKMNVVCKLLSYMFDIGVLVSAFNFEQGSILDVAANLNGLWMVPRLHGLIVDRDRGHDFTEIAHRQSKYSYGFAGNNQLILPLNIFNRYPEVSEDLGFSDLFMTVLKKDIWKLRDILKSRSVTSIILQKDLYNRNILHVSTDWPAGLKALLEHKTVARPLMNALSSLCFSPLDDALRYSKLQCTALDQWTVCHDCACFIPTQLLLESDCSVTIGWDRPLVLMNCSLRARMLFFQHMKDRRQRLRQIAVKVLPSTFLERYGIDTESLPDATAMVLWDELQEKEYESRQLVYGSIDSLKPYCYIDRGKSESFFQQPHHLKVALLACDYGFRPRDEPGVPTFLSRHLNNNCAKIEEYIAYLDWLLQHDLELELHLGPFRLSAFHRLAILLGKNIRIWSRKERGFPDLILMKTRILFSEMCSDMSQSNIPCPCNSGIFNRPLSCLISGMTAVSLLAGPERFWQDIQRTIDDVVLMLDLIENSTYGPGTLYLFKSTVHILTMTALGIRHLPICYIVNSDPEEYKRLDRTDYRQEWTEMIDEDQWLIDRLHTLDEEFSLAFENENVSIADFLRNYWLKRMEEVIQRLCKPLDDEDRCNLHEIGVVLDEENTTNLLLGCKER